MKSAIDLEIVRAILETQLKEFRDMETRAQESPHEWNRAQAHGGIVALEQTIARLGKYMLSK